MLLNAIKLLIMTSVLLKQHSVAGNCENPIPGVGNMIKGVDITTLDLVPLRGTTPNGIRHPLFSVTCSKGNKRKFGSTIYDLPDEVWNFNSLPGGYSQAEIRFVKTASEIRDRLKVGVKIGGGYGTFAFSSSASYQKMQNSVMNSSKQIEDISSYESSFQITLLPYFFNVKLDNRTQGFIDNIPKGTYRQNREIYNTFVEYFGTHFIWKGTFGGMIKSYMETSTKYSSKMTDEQISAQVEASYTTALHSVSASVSLEKDSTKVSSEFTNETKTSIKYYGGDTNLLDSDGLKTWQQSVDKNPWLFEVELVPIYKLIGNKEKQIHIKTAIDQHIQRAYLTELIRLVIYAKIKYPDKLLNDLHNRIIKLQRMKMLDLYEVASLRKKVEYHAIVPHWFLFNTRICLQYYAEKTGHGQCNGDDNIQPRNLCSIPNKYTPGYIDNTSSKPGGCVMQWTIISDNPDRWFIYTQLCFQFESIWGGWNVENGLGWENCTRVHELTRKYIDDTQKAEDRTVMSWKLKLDSSPPLWLKNSKLCFKWSHYGNDRLNDQCGKGASGNELCAYPDTWTEWYSDITMSHVTGGCEMSWSWKVDI